MKNPGIKTKKIGQSLVEFALALPIIMLIILGTIQFGFMLYQKGILTDIARDGARAAALTGNNTLACRVILNRAQELGFPGIKGVVDLSEDGIDAIVNLSFGGQIFTSYRLEARASYLVEPDRSLEKKEC